MHGQNQQDSRLLTTDEVIAYYAISRPTLMRWIRERGCPVVRLPGLLRFEQRAVAEWVQQLSAHREPQSRSDLAESIG